MSSFEVAWILAKNDARMFPKDICNDCGIDVSRGSGISVNRIPADTIQGLYPGGFEQFVDDRQGYGILSRYNPETLRWIYENPSEVDTGWRCALCEVDAYADMEAPDHPEVEDGLWNTALAMDLSSKNTLHYQEFMERFGHLKEHHPDVFNMIEQRLDILGEDGSDFQASATLFEASWDSITKAPYHITERENIESIMQSGLEPRYPGHNVMNITEAIDAVLEEHGRDFDEDEALNQLNEIAQELGFKHANELYDPSKNWVYAINDDHVGEVLNDLSGYGSSMKEPVLLHLDNSYKNWMPDYGFTSLHVRSPFTVPPQNIQIEIDDLPKQADFDDRTNRYQEALEEAFTNHFFGRNQ